MTSSRSGWPSSRPAEAAVDDPGEVGASGQWPRRAERTGRAWTTSPSELGLIRQTRSGRRPRRSAERGRASSRELPFPGRIAAGYRNQRPPGVATATAAPDLDRRRADADPAWSDSSCCALAVGRRARRGDVPARPRPRPTVPELFRLGRGDLPLRAGAGPRRRPATRVAAVRFPSPVVTPDPENNTVHAEYFRPDRRRASGRRWWCSTSSGPTSPCRATRRPAGRPGGRRPVRQAPLLRRAAAGRGGTKRFLSADIERSVARDAPGGLRRPPGRRPGWRAGPRSTRTGSGVTGISLGGIVSSLAAAVDPTDRPGRVPPGRRRPRRDPLGRCPRRAKYRKLWIDVGPDLGRPQGADRPVRPADLRRPAQGQAAADDRRQRRRGHPPRLRPRPLGGRRPAADHAGTTAATTRPPASSSPPSARRSSSSPPRSPADSRADRPSLSYASEVALWPPSPSGSFAPKSPQSVRAVGL